MRVYSSAWRYEAGKDKVEAINRTKGYMDLDSFIELLQAVSHGTTEHSVIYHQTGATEFWLANSESEGSAWDAPYRKYHHFVFEQFFTEWNTTTTRVPM